MSNKRTEISDLGEFGLIDRITQQAHATNPKTIMGIGDDASVFQSNQEEVVLLSSDMLLEGVHFDLSYVPLQHLGYKAVVVNLSDIAAMNGRPRQVLVNVAISNRFSVEAIEVFYSGVRRACEQFEVDLVGGDTTTSRGGLVISVSVFGQTAPEKVVYRNGANLHDLVCVSGDLGAAFMGLQVLEREKQAYLANPDLQPNLTKYEYVVGRQLRPVPRLDVLDELEQAGLQPTAMIDISDGLVSDVFHICKAAELGVSIYEEKLPISKEAYETAAEFQIDPNTAALNGGEDYELLLTLPASANDAIEAIEALHVIGFMQEKEKGKGLVTRQNNVVELVAQGWKHF